MRIEEIPASESDFDANHKDSNGKNFTYSEQTAAIPGESVLMKYINLKPVSGDNTYFYRHEYQKSQIVLHYTVGYLKGDIATLTQHDYHVSVPFVIGRNGLIYNLFYSGYWAYHLGRGAVGGNETGSRRTIGIEISNIGGLARSGNSMINYYGTPYCNTGQTNAYINKSFRRFNYFATFTDAQYDSLVILLRYLTAKYGIGREFLPDRERYETTGTVTGFNGIVTHINYRPSDKEDIGPAFDWERVIEAVRS